MRRRPLLAFAVSLAVGSGCTGSDDRPSAESTVTPAPVPTSSPTVSASPSDAQTRPGSVDVNTAVVQPGVVRPGIDSISVTDDAGQYLVLDIGGDAPDRSAVAFRFNGASHVPEQFRTGIYRGDFDGEEYGQDGGPLVFGLPETGDGTDAGLAWGDGSWAPPSTVVERLEDPLPPFAVSIDGPGTAAAADDPALTIGVTNEGETAGRYVMALNRQGPRTAYAPVRRLAGALDAGASETYTVDAVPPEGEASTQYVLDVPGRPDSPTHTIQPTE